METQKLRVGGQHINPSNKRSRNISMLYEFITYILVNAPREYKIIRAHKTSERRPAIWSPLAGGRSVLFSLIMRT